MSRSLGKPISVGACPVCGKLRWVSKSDAKRATRQIQGRVGRLHPYRCGSYWHVGHPPSLLVRGVIARDQVTQAQPRVQARRTR